MNFGEVILSVGPPVPYSDGAASAAATPLPVSAAISKRMAADGARSEIKLGEVWYLAPYVVVSRVAFESVSNQKRDLQHVGVDSPHEGAGVTVFVGRFEV